MRDSWLVRVQLNVSLLTDPNKLHMLPHELLILFCPPMKIHPDGTVGAAMDL